MDKQIREVKGSMTVEAAWVMSFCMIITALTIIAAFDVFDESLEKVSKPSEKIDAVQMFLKKEALTNIIEGFADGE